MQLSHSAKPNELFLHVKALTKNTMRHYINSDATYHTAIFAHIIKNPYICESATQQIEILKTINTKSATDHIPVA